MKRMAFKMKLLEGKETDYRKRHEQIWPELSIKLKEAGIKHYSIFLDPENFDLFAVLEISDPANLEKLAGEDLMKKWWNFMKDIMETNPDHSPASIPLKEVFYLP
jgi:L-rhamnose mutarotase